MSDPLASPLGCLSLPEVSRSLAELAAPHDTTTMLPRNVSVWPLWFTATSVTAVPVEFVLSLITCALVSNVTFENLSAGRTARTSASDLAWTTQGKPSQSIQRTQVLNGMFFSFSMIPQGAWNG